MWIYSNNQNNMARYTLGEPGKNNLICIGINPSTAEPEKLDSTLTVVKKLSLQHNFDGWIMINIYPQRATNPNNLHKEIDLYLHNENLKHIQELIQIYPQFTIWAAWGTLIEKRKYLKHCLFDIYKLLNNRWISIGPISKNGHPHHPLYLKHDSEIFDFNIQKYIDLIKK